MLWHMSFARFFLGPTPSNLGEKQVFELDELTHNLVSKKRNGIMNKGRLLRAFGCVVGTVLLATTVVQAQGPFILDVRGGVEVWSVPQPDPGPGYEATKVVLRGVDPASKPVTFENLRFDGELVQTWLSGPFGTDTSKNVVAGPTYPAEWIPFDSHLLISSMPPPSMIGSDSENGFNGISETNDNSIGQIPGLSLVQDRVPPVSGIGPISMVDPTDTFFLDSAFQTNEVSLAYLVGQTGVAAAAGHMCSARVLSTLVIQAVPNGDSVKTLIHFQLLDIYMGIFVSQVAWNV